MESNETKLTEEPVDRRRLLRIVMWAVLVWGSVLALGATLFGIDPTGGVHYAPNLVRGLIVEACVLGFMGVWILALSRQPKAGN